MNARHTKEKEKYWSYMFYVNIFQRFWPFVLYNYTFVAFSYEIITNLKKSESFGHTCKKRVIPVIYHRKFFWIFRKILG